MRMRSGYFASIDPRSTGSPPRCWRRRRSTETSSMRCSGTSSPTPAPARRWGRSGSSPCLRTRRVWRNTARRWGSIARVQARGIHHLGVAVDDLDEAVSTYEQIFGARLEHRETVPEQGVEAASLKVGEGRVELLASLGEETPVGKFLTKRGPGMHHVAYEVADVRAAIDELAQQGVELVDEEPREGLFGLEVAFLHPDAVHGVLAELVADG